MTVEKGIRVLIAEQDIALLPVEEGFTISPGVSASISLRKVNFLTISVPNQIFFRMISKQHIMIFDYDLIAVIATMSVSFLGMQYARCRS